MLVERAGIERGVEVAAEQLWTLGAQLALFAHPGDATVERHHSQLDSRNRPALCHRQLLVVVGDVCHGENRSFGEAPAGDDAHAPELGFDVVVQLRWLRRTASGKHAAVREETLPRLHALRREVRHVERRAGTAECHLLALQHRDGRRGHERFDEDQPAPGHEAGVQPADPADVREREHHCRTIFRNDLERDRHAVGLVSNAAVGVTRAFRLAGGSRRVEDPTHRRLLGIRTGRHERRQRVWIALGERPVAHHDVVSVLGRDRARHRLVVEAPPRRRHDQQYAPGLLGDETNFSFAVDGQHWVLHDAEPRQRAYEDERLEPRRQQPRDVRFGADPQGLEPRSDAQCLLAVLRKRQRATVLVDGVDGVRGERGTPLDELPQTVVRVEHVRFGHVTPRDPGPQPQVTPPSMVRIWPTM